MRIKQKVKREKNINMNKSSKAKKMTNSYMWTSVQSQQDPNPTSQCAGRFVFTEAVDTGALQHVPYSAAST